VQSDLEMAVLTLQRAKQALGRGMIVPGQRERARDLESANLSGEVAAVEWLAAEPRAQVQLRPVGTDAALSLSWIRLERVWLVAV
jgi:hypothetical protein